MIIFWETFKSFVPVSVDPGVGNVREGTSYEITGVPKTGTLHLPVSVDPGVINVRLGLSYLINDVTYVGTLIPKPPRPIGGVVGDEGLAGKVIDE